MDQKVVLVVPDHDGHDGGLGLKCGLGHLVGWVAVGLAHIGVVVVVA